MITDYRDQNGHVRKLARLEPTSEHKKMRAARTNIQSWRQQNGLQGLVDEKDWVIKDNRSIFDSRFLVNQHQCSGCTGFSDACAEMKVQYMSSGNLVVFSGAFVYAQINGGRDDGSVITDAMVANQQVGQIPLSMFDIPNLEFRGRPQDLSQFTAQAAPYKATFDLTVGDWLEAMTAIQMGFVVQLPIQVGSNFESFDQYGACGFSNGSGNHSVHVDGAILLPNGMWALTMMNSWGAWGPNRDGRCLLYQKHVDGAGSADDAFAHCSSQTQGLPQLA